LPANAVTAFASEQASGCRRLKAVEEEKRRRELRRFFGEGRRLECGYQPGTTMKDEESIGHALLMPVFLLPDPSSL
jgi:hypothetical protein